MNAIKTGFYCLVFALSLYQSVATEFSVTRLENDGSGSLRDAMVKANATPGMDTIRIHVGGTISAPTPLPAITEDLIIIGQSTKATIISGQSHTNDSSLFRVQSSASVFLRNLAIKNAISSTPGAALHNSGIVTLENCLISDNQSMNQGGGIYNSGHLVCLSSTICSNTVIGNKGPLIVTAGGGGAGKGTGGGIQIAGGSVWMTNCTVSGNIAIGGQGGDNSQNDGGGGGGGGEGSGAGIFVSNGTLTLVNVTVARNHAIGGLGGAGSGGGGNGGDGTSRGGGIFTENGTVRLLNSLIADNQANAWVDTAATLGSFQSLGHNLLGSLPTHQSGTNWLSSTDLANTPPLLEALGDYGGSTLTHRLLPTSPAIDRGATLLPGSPVFDQRGALRPQNLGVDIGAVESGKIIQTVTINPVADITYGDVPFQTMGKSSSGLPVTFSVVNDLNAKITDTHITSTGAGVATVKATQPGDDNYFPASSVESFTIHKAILTVNAVDMVKTFGDPNPDLKISLSGFKFNETSTVLNVQPMASTFATKYSSVGTYPIVVSGGIDDNYALIGFASATLTILPAFQSVQFDPIPTKVYGDTFAISAISSSGLPVSFKVISGPATSSGLHGATITTTNIGTVAVQAVQLGDSNHPPTGLTFQSFEVIKAPLTVKGVDVIVPFGQTIPPVQITFIGFKLGETITVLDVPPKASTLANPTSPVGIYPIAVTGGSDNHYTWQSDSRGTVTITPAAQVIAFDPILPKIYGDVFTVKATTPSGLPVTFNVVGGPATATGQNGSTITVTSVGTVTLQATQPGDGNHQPAAGIVQSFEVFKAPLTVKGVDVIVPFGQTTPPVQITFTGFKLGETNTVLDVPPKATTLANSTSPVGIYPIAVTGGSDDHYTWPNDSRGTVTIIEPTPPPTVTLVSPTNGTVYIQPINLNLIVETTGSLSPISKVEFFGGDARIGITNTAPFFVTWTNVPAGTNIIFATVTYENGTTNNSAPILVTVLEEVPVVHSAVVTNGLYFRQTGLFQQTITLSNPTPIEVNGLRLFIENLPDRTQVANATGITNGIHFIQYNTVIPAGQSVSIPVDYYVPTRVVPTPTFSTQIVTSQPSVPIQGTPLSISRQLWLQNLGFLLEFETELLKTYFIQYTDNLQNWKTAWPAISGNCSKIQWIDNGPPRTESSPVQQSQRTYRVISIP